MFSNQFYFLSFYKFNDFSLLNIYLFKHIQTNEVKHKNNIFLKK